jgi:hypothetical protein
MQLITEDSKAEKYRLSKIYRSWSLTKLLTVYYSDESNIYVR